MNQQQHPIQQAMTRARNFGAIVLVAVAALVIYFEQQGSKTTLDQVIIAYGVVLALVAGVAVYAVILLRALLEDMGHIQRPQPIIYGANTHSSPPPYYGQQPVQGQQPNGWGQPPVQPVAAPPVVTPQPQGQGYSGPGPIGPI